MRNAFLPILMGTACGACSEPPSTVAATPASAHVERTLEQRAYDVLRGRCWGCHGEPGKKAFGETGAVDWILDYDKLIDYSLVIPGKPGKSRLVYITAVEGKMPRAFDENGIPSLADSLTDDEQQILIDWVKAGAPRWPPRGPKEQP